MVPSHAARGDISMKNILAVLLLLSSLLLAQQSNPSATSQPKSKDAKGQVTVQGCVGKFSGDYILTKQDPGITYELQATGKTKLRHYLGQRVEVTGTEAPSMSSSSDALNKTGSASPVTITITSIKTISQECTVHQVADK
jgi:ABC-type phosphate transport system substrate-binding protein